MLGFDKKSSLNLPTYIMLPAALATEGEKV